MIILKILLVLLSILFLFLLCILFIPFGYRIKAVGLDEKSVRLGGVWIFGLLGFSGGYVLNQGFEGNVNVLGLKINIDETNWFKDKKSKDKKDKKKKKKKERKKKKEFSIEAFRYVFTSIKKVLFHLMPDKIQGYGRLGFYDPYYTGITCSFVESIRGLGLHTLNLDYVFDDEVYEGEIYIEGRIVVIYIVFVAIRLLLNKSTRKLIF